MSARSLASASSSGRSRCWIGSPLGFQTRSRSTPQPINRALNTTMTPTNTYAGATPAASGSWTVRSASNGSSHANTGWSARAGISPSSNAAPRARQR